DANGDEKLGTSIIDTQYCFGCLDRYSWYCSTADRRHNRCYLVGYRRIRCHGRRYILSVKTYYKATKDIRWSRWIRQANDKNKSRFYGRTGVSLGRTPPPVKCFATPLAIALPLKNPQRMLRVF